MIIPTKATLAALAVTAAAAAAASVESPAVTDPGTLTVHEWGTFTSIAGPDGRAVPWLPLRGPSDLPGFVHRASNLPPKTDLTATVRMETPVLYFYASRNGHVDVNVRFRQGLITEHFPRGTVGPAGIDNASMGTPGFEGGITWRNVRIRPGATAAFPAEDAPSHYYAARRAGATPLSVGFEREGFLFYRGLGNFDLPVRATVGADGEVEIATAGSGRVSALVLFANRGGRVGYEVAAAPSRRVRLAPLRMTGDLASLQDALERMLVAEGLYPKEAAAMVATWSDSWFGEGTRLFYVVPRSVVDAVLPLEIRPAPATVARVFVGRLELVTPDTLTELERALEANDCARLASVGRFLRPFADRLLARPMPAGRRERIERRVTAALADAR